jgi:hypothetical protein
MRCLSFSTIRSRALERKNEEGRTSAKNTEEAVSVHDCEGYETVFEQGFVNAM